MSTPSGKIEVLRGPMNPDKLQVFLMEPKNRQQITIDPTKLAVVPISHVRINTWNPKDKDTDQYRDVYESIKANGLMGFIVVRENTALIDGVESLYEIIDGEQRFTSCKELEYEEIVIYNEGQVADKRARELTVWWQAQVPFNQLSLAKMISASIAEYGDFHSYFSEKQLEEMKKLAQFDWNQYKAAETPPPPVGELLKSFSVQVTNQQYDTVSDAMEQARKSVGEEELTDGELITIICRTYLDTFNKPAAELSSDASPAE